MALPFFRNTIAGDLFYVGSFFGLMEAITWVLNLMTTKKLIPSFAKGHDVV
jgi:hypothetical protein